MDSDPWSVKLLLSSWFFFFFNYCLFLFSFVVFKYLQCCVGFSCIIIQISHNYTYIMFLPSVPHPVPPGNHRAQDWTPCAKQQLLTSYHLTPDRVYMLMLLSAYAPPSPSPTVSLSPFSTSVSPFLPCK